MLAEIGLADALTELTALASGAVAVSSTLKGRDLKALTEGALQRGGALLIPLARVTEATASIHARNPAGAVISGSTRHVRDTLISDTEHFWPTIDVVDTLPRDATPRFTLLSIETISIDRTALRGTHSAQATLTRRALGIDHTALREEATVRSTDGAQRTIPIKVTGRG